MKYKMSWLAPAALAFWRAFALVDIWVFVGNKHCKLRKVALAFDVLLCLQIQIEFTLYRRRNHHCPCILVHPLWLRPLNLYEECS